MKEKRKGPISIAGGLVDSVAATVRRMQRDREPRVLAYDPTGYARLIQPEARGHERILEIGEAMVALSASEGPRPAREAVAEEPPAPAEASVPTKAGRAKKTRARASSKSGTAKSGRGRSGSAKTANGKAKAPKRPAKAQKPARARSAKAANTDGDTPKARKPRAKRASRQEKA